MTVLADPRDPVLCECGCGQGVSKRFVHGHNRRIPLMERFINKLLVMPNGCWEWTANKNRDGYGSLGARRGAHRVAYQLFVGPIPDGLTLDHLCRNRGCVNPGHLEPVARGENVLRGVGPAAQNARKTHCPRGHAYDAENTYVSPAGKRYCRTCKTIRRTHEALARLEQRESDEQ